MNSINQIQSKENQINLGKAKSPNKDNESFEENMNAKLYDTNKIKNKELNLLNFTFNKNKREIIEKNSEETKIYEENQDTQKTLINYNNPEFKIEIFSLFDSQGELNFFKDNSSKDNSINNEENSKDKEFSFKINCKDTPLESDFHIFNMLNSESCNNDSLNNNYQINNSDIVTNEQDQDINMKNEIGENDDEKINTNITDNNIHNNNSKDEEKNAKEDELCFNIKENNEKKYPKRKREKSDFKRNQHKNKKIEYIGENNGKNKPDLIDLVESEDDNSNKEEESHKYKYPKIKKSIKIKKERSFFSWNLCYPNILLDKYALAFSLMMNREYPPVKKFLVYHSKKDTYAFIQLITKISYCPNTNKKLYFNFGEHTPKVRGAKSWRCHINNINKNNIDDYFTNIDIKNVIIGKSMRNNMFFKKDPQDQDETCLNDITKIPQIKMAHDYIRNIIAQKKCDYNKRCFWIKCDKNVDLSLILDLNNDDIYIKALNHSWVNYSDQKTVIILLKENYSEEIDYFLKTWIENERIKYSNGYYDIVPVHNKVVIFSFWSLDEYFKGDLFGEPTLKLRFEKSEIKSRTDIKKFIEEMNNEF